MTAVMTFCIKPSGGMSQFKRRFTAGMRCLASEAPENWA